MIVVKLSPQNLLCASWSGNCSPSRRLNLFFRNAPPEEVDILKDSIYQHTVSYVYTRFFEFTEKYRILKFIRMKEKRENK